MRTLKRGMPIHSIVASMLMHKTDLTVLVTSPISLTFLVLTVYFAWKFGARKKFKPKIHQGV